MAEETFGREGNEADAGWTQMPAPPKEDEKEYNGDAGGLRDAANDLAAERANRWAERLTEPGYRAHEPEATVQRNYVYQGGEQHGEPVERNESVTLERAANDLNTRRTAEIVSAQQQQAAEIAAMVDQFRGVAPPGQQLQQAETTPTAEQPPAELQPQPETPVTQPGIDPELAQALQSNPKLRAALEQELSVIQRAKEGFDLVSAQAQEAYAAATAEATRITAAALYSNFPELAGLEGERLTGAIQAIARQNPERAAQIRTHIDRAQHVNNMMLHAQAQQQQRAAQQFTEYARQQDAAFDDAIAQEPKSVVKQVRDELLNIAKEKYNVAPDDFVRAFQTNPIMRSAPFQKMMYDAARFHLAQKTAAQNKAPANLPPVQRPGSGEQRADYSQMRIAEAAKAFRDNPTPQNGKALLMARRASQQRELSRGV